MEIRGEERVSASKREKSLVPLSDQNFRYGAWPPQVPGGHAGQLEIGWQREK